ncbi:MAG: hypothetical protein ACI4UV_05255 [Victivallales bacterium]
MLKKTMVMAVFLLAATVSNGAVLLDSPEEVFIRNRQNKVWTFPAVKSARRVTVEFRHRIDFNRPAGWCPCWQIEVNGEKLNSMATRKYPRLLNKPFRWYHKYHGYYKVDNQADKWYSLYLQDYHAADKYFVPENPEATRVILDITDVVKTDAPNEIRIRFGGVPESYYISCKVFDRKPALAVKDFKVCQYLVASPLKPIKKMEERIIMRQLKNPDFKIIPEKENLFLELKGEKIPIVSRFTVPGGKWVELSSQETLATSHYKISRKYVKHANRVDFFDTITSTSEQLIGLKVQYGTPLADFDPVYVAGDSNPAATEFTGGRNPSVYGALPRKGLGIAFLAVDDILRVQNIARCNDKFFNIGSDTLALSPGESRTLEWSLYPTARADYYDFINTARKDWNVNFPIAGSFNLSMNVYSIWSQADAQRNTRNMGLSMNTFGVHFWSHLRRIDPKYNDYTDGIWGPPRSGQMSRVKLRNGTVIKEDPAVILKFENTCVEKARKFTPDLKILSYIHNQISVKANDAKYEDARLVDSKGRCRNYNGGAHEKIFIPTLENTWGKDFLDDVDWYLKNLDLDGLYWDEMNHTNERIYCGSAMWDTVSVELDNKFNVKRKISYVPLLKLPFTLKLIKKIIGEHKKLLIGNFSPETRSELRYQFPRFEETYNNRWVALSHLYTPIQLGDMLTYANTPRDMAADMRNALFRGALYYHYLGHTRCPSLSSKMFPFTPRELHSGYLIGEERILTALSGDFGWYGENRLAQTFVFDELGQEVPDYPAKVSGMANGTQIRLQLKKDYCASLVAIPVNCELKGVTLDQIKYADGKLTCLAKGNGIAVFMSGSKKQSFIINGLQKIIF